ncbi:MAG: hypothetical protein GFH25_541198n67 [Chloroflexi bacterium AL-N10]|nr:hypothetical protein [Chloroflexi bacterium AL-N10]
MSEDYDAWLAELAAHQVATVQWTWYAFPDAGCACTDEQITLQSGQHKHLTQIAEQAIYETIWELSEYTRDDLAICENLGVFRLDVATRTLCKVAEVGDWEADDYHPDSGPYVPSIHPLPDDTQPCYVIGTG